MVTDSMIIEAVKSGKKNKDVAEELGIASSTVRRVLRRSGISSRTAMLRSEQTTRRMAAMYQEGFSQKDIADVLGCHEQTVEQLFRDAGIKARDEQGRHTPRMRGKLSVALRQVTEAECSLIVDQYRAGKPMQLIAQALGRSTYTIHKILKNSKSLIRGKRFDAEELESMKDLYLKGYSLQAVADRLGCHICSVSYHLDVMGVVRRPAGTRTEITKLEYSYKYSSKVVGGRYVRKKDGYTTIYMPKHPMANRWGLIAEHRLIMETHLVTTDPKHPALKDSLLQRAWHVHHVNGIKSDNRIENLELKTPSEHASLHLTERWRQLKQDSAQLRELLHK